MRCVASVMWKEKNVGINRWSWRVKVLLTIANAWLRVEQEQEADDFASAFVKVSRSLAFCAVQNQSWPASRPDRTLFGVYLH
jgi:hypothetical protein